MAVDSATVSVAAGVFSSAAMPSGVASVVVAVGAAASLACALEVGKAETGAAALDPGAAAGAGLPSPQQAPSNRHVTRSSKLCGGLIQEVACTLTLSGVRGLAN